MKEEAGKTRHSQEGTRFKAIVGKNLRSTAWVCNILKSIDFIFWIGEEEHREDYGRETEMKKKCQ